MTQDTAAVASRIRTDLLRIAACADEIRRGLDLAAAADTRRFVLGGIALDLQSAYTGFERIFQVIAEVIDGVSLNAGTWHQDLLRRVASTTDFRPAIVVPASAGYLQQLLQFRHVIRNIYSQDLELDRVEAIALQFDTWFQAISVDLLLFADFLDETE